MYTYPQIVGAISPLANRSAPAAIVRNSKAIPERHSVDFITDGDSTAPFGFMALLFDRVQAGHAHTRRRFYRRVQDAHQGGESKLIDFVGRPGVAARALLDAEVGGLRLPSAEALLITTVAHRRRYCQLPASLVIGRCQIVRTKIMHRCGLNCIGEPGVGV